MIEYGEIICRCLAFRTPRFIHCGIGNLYLAEGILAIRSRVDSSALRAVV